MADVYQAPRPYGSLDIAIPPSEAWQQAGRDFTEACERELWTPAGQRALAWLRSRGLSDMIIKAAHLGYNRRETYDSATGWGLPGNKNRVWLPRGIVIPWHVGGVLWRVNIRRPSGKPKYVGPAGSANGLYNADTLNRLLPVILTEGEFDTQTIAQCAGDLVSAVATGSSSGSHRLCWIGKLALAPLVLIAYDCDAAGENGSRFWLNTLRLARRWRPYSHDINSMAEAGIDVRHWVRTGLAEFGWQT